MNDRYSYLVVEDEDLPRKNLINLLNRRPDLQMIGDFSSAEQAYNFLLRPEVEFPDLIFLDIRMEGQDMDGAAFLESYQQLTTKSKIIIVSAYYTYAVDLYNEADGYVAKPINIDKLNAVIDKAISELVLPAELTNKLIIVRSGDRYIKIAHEEIVYCEAAGPYTKIFTTDNAKQPYKIRELVGDMEIKLPSQIFFRIHNSFIINLDRIHAWAKNYSFVCMKGYTDQIPIGPKFYNTFREIIRRKYPFEE